MDGVDDAAFVAEHRFATDAGATNRECLAVCLLDDDDEVARLDVIVGLDDTGAHHVCAIGDELDSACVDGDHPPGRLVSVRAPDREERVALDIAHEWLPIDQHHVPAGILELDGLEGFGVEFDSDGIRERSLNLFDSVRAEVVTRFDVHTRR